MTYTNESYAKPTYRTDAQIAIATVKYMAAFVACSAIAALVIMGVR